MQLGCGLVTLDYLATVDAYPRPDDKIRSGELQVTHHTKPNPPLL